MKFVSFAHQNQPAWFMATNTAVIELSSAGYPTLQSALQAGRLDQIAAAPPVGMKPGDRVEIEGSKGRALGNTIAADAERV
jgi:hypothetical protein